jgi:hypothetical protein
MLPDMDDHVLDHAPHMGVVGAVIDLLALPVRPHQPRAFQQTQMVADQRQEFELSAMSKRQGVRRQETTMRRLTAQQAKLSRAVASSSERRVSRFDI